MYLIKEREREMKRKFISAVLAVAMLPITAAIPTAGVAAAEAKVPQYQEKQRLMEDLGRGLIASYRTVDNRNVMNGEGGVYLSWRLLGTESLTNQAFDIYRSTNGTTFTKIYTTGAHEATNYIDKTGTMSYSYKVVKAGASQSEVAAEKAVKPYENHAAKGSEVGNGNSEKNSFTYVDIPISRPDPSRKVGGGESLYYSTGDREGGANDASVGDLDGDGEYEIVLKWDPYDSKDSASNGYTGRVYIDGYEIDPNNDGYMWRIDLGQNVTAGAHYTQFIVYDFDGDGKSEIAMTTAPGTIDGTGHYVSEVGDTDEIRNVDNTAVFLSSRGKNVGPEYYTIFDGETGAALYTTDAIPLGANENGSEWGDSKANRAYRYLAGVAYLDGVHPSYIACRGYYNKAVIRAYSWDGNEMYLEWEHNASSAASDNMYGQGNHNLSIADVDNDGFDEIVYGSAVLDHDGSRAIGNTGYGHGDALHVNDFNNDGIQEAFSVKEDKPQYGANFRVAATGQSFWSKSASGDTGRGVMDNIDDEYAKEHPDTGLALAWSSSHANAFDLAGNEVAAKPSASSRSMCNFLVFWDGDLGRELLDDTIIAKYHADTGITRRFYSSDGYSLTGSSSNNFTKYTPCLSADIWGDWREEIIMSVNKASATEQAYLRIFTSTIPTEYRLTTLMHDAQYRCAIAWQNVGYNQPPHTSYYVGSASLATDGTNTMNYLAPTTKFTNVVYEVDAIPVTGVTLSETEINLERTKTTRIQANIEPAEATKKGVTWTSSNPAVATISNGIITGVSNGTATITAKTRDGGYTAECKVNVYSNPVTGIELSDKEIEVGIGYSKTLTAEALPDNATDKTIKWTSGNPAVVKVDQNGVLTGVMTGAAIVTAETADGGYKAECFVKVYPFSITDETGSNAFSKEGEDSNTSISTSANSASIKQNDSVGGAVVSKTFTSYSDNKATFSFRVTTGGQRIDGANWNWTGHEYTLKMSMLDDEGNNLLTLAQPYGNNGSGGAGAMTATILGNGAENVESTWTTDGNMGTIQGSSKRLSVTVEFNYDEDKCYVTLLGCDDAWEETGRAEKQFDLNGTSFGEFKFLTEVNGSGTLTASPSLSNVSYIRTELQGGGMDDDVQPTLTPTEVPVYNWTTDFDEGERMSVSVNGTQVEFTTASNANNARGSAYCDLSKYIEGENRYTIEYDSMLPSTSRARIALCDISQRPADSNKNGYNTTGVAFVQGVVDGSSYTINENKEAYNLADARDQFVHTKITVNALAKTYDFEITDNSGKVLASGNNVSYLDSNLEAPNGIEMLNTINDNKTYINNLDITSYIYPGPDQTLPPTAEPKPTVGPTSTPSPTQPPTEVPSQAPTPSPTPVAIVNTTTAFEAKERMTLSVNGNEITFKAASNANNGRGTAYCDLSEYIDGYDEYIVEYDSNLPSGSRARVAFCDISQRPGTSNKSGYDKTGVAFVQGVVDGNSYAVNEDKSLYGIPAARDQYVHTKLTVNAAAKTIDFVITDSTGAVLTQQEGISYLDTGLESPNGIELLDIINDSETKIKDLKVTVYEKYEEPTEPPVTYETYGESGIAIIAVYNEDGTLKSLTTQAVEAGDPVIKSENANEKVFAWDSLDGMKPISIKVEAATAAPTVLPTEAPTANPTDMPTEAPTAPPTAAPGATIDPNVTYSEVFSDSESFLMADAPETNKWIVSSDGILGSTASEDTSDVAGNTTAKLKLENKAVQYVLDDAITSGCFKLQYDFLVMKDDQTYGRYFRTYLDNAAHDYSTETGQASAMGNENAFFHMMDMENMVYVTRTADLVGATQDSTNIDTDAVKLSDSALESGKWYRVVIEGDLDNGLVNVKYYDHGDQYNESLDISSATPVIDCDGCFTEGRARELKQIKFMRTAGGVLYYDNIKLEKETAE